MKASRDSSKDMKDLLKGLDTVEEVRKETGARSASDYKESKSAMMAQLARPNAPKA